jgi:hypothetical protein
VAGLLDYLSPPDAGNGVGGLLSYLNSPLYQSPLLTPQAAPQPQYDAMGNYTGITPDAPNPFGPIPQMNMPTPAQFSPPSVFNGGVAAAPVAGIPSLGPQGSAPQPITPAPQQAQPEPPLRSMNIGGYQMPQVGSASDYAPQTPTDVSAQSRVALQPQQQDQLPYALGGRPDGFFDRLNTGLQSIGNGGSIIGALTGNRTDPQSYAQQSLSAQYRALVPIVGPQKAMLAVLNPEAGKTILAQALEKKNYGFTKLDNDTLLRTDPLTGKAEVAYGGGEDRGTITGPDGKQIAIPPGVDRKTFVNEISRANAKAQAGEKTEVQAKSEKFANKMETAEKNLSGIINEGASVTGRGLDMVPGGNFLQSDKYQKYRQAQDNFITALLRDESGAAIGTAEFKRYERELFPQPGDGPQVIAQKAEARKTAIEAMKKSAGPGYKSPEGAGPAVGAVQQGYRFKGGNPADRNSWERVQ